MLLSIIIVSWNAKDYLENCLKSVFGTIKGIDFEVIVVDNASTDGSPEMVSANFSDVKLIKNDRNIGFGPANNCGIKDTSGDYILLLNPDTLLLENSVANLVNFIRKEETIGVVGPKILNPDGTVQYECARNFPTPLTEFFVLTTLYKRFPRSKIFGRYLMSYWDHSQEREVESISGSCALIKRSALNEVGLFDECFFMYSEETDLFYRIKKKGWKIYFVPSAEIIHHWGKSTQQAPLVMAVKGRRSMELFFKKHYGLGSVLAHRFLVVIAATSIIFGCIIMYINIFSKDKARFKTILFKNYFMLGWALGFK